MRKGQTIIKIVAYLTMLINITKMQVPAVAKCDIQVGKKHIASICLKGTLIRSDPELKQYHGDSLLLVVLQEV